MQRINLAACGTKKSFVLKILFAAMLALIFSSAICLFVGGPARARKNFASAAETLTAADPEPQSISYGEDIPLGGGQYELQSVMQEGGGEMLEGGALSAPLGVGSYTVTVSPAQGYEFADKSASKQFALTVDKSRLVWTFPSPDKDVQEEVSKSVEFRSNTDRIDNVFAANEKSPSMQYSHGDGTMRVTAAGVQTEKAVEVGEYVFTVQDEANYENPTFTLKVTPQILDIGDSNLFGWIVDGYPLADGTIYAHSYAQGGETLTEYLSRPAQAGDEPVTVQGAIACYVSRSGEPAARTIQIKKTPAGAPSHIVASFSGTSSASQSGKYTFTATLSAEQNYSLSYDASSSTQPSSMIITPKGDGTYTVEQEWYVVQFVNALLSEPSSSQSGEEVDFTMPSWTFGQFPDNLKSPALSHGDGIRMYESASEQEKSKRVQPDGYTLFVGGEEVLSVRGDLSAGGHVEYREQSNGQTDWQSGAKDAVTFTIYKDGVPVCLDIPRSRWSYYFNSFMPEASYTVEIKTADILITGRHNHWWNGEPSSDSATYFGGMVKTYSFTVSNAPFDYDDTAVNYNTGGEKQPIQCDLALFRADPAAFFAGVEQKLTLGDMATRAKAEASGTYWGEEGVADTYFRNPPVMYFNAAGGVGSFYEQTFGGWANLISAPQKINLYYRLRLPNYEEVTSTRFVTVNFYEVVDIPVLENSSKLWSGEEQTFAPAGQSPLYDISANIAKNAGEYWARFTLKNPENYRWKEAENNPDVRISGAVCEVKFTVQKLANGWQDGKNPAVSSWQEGGFSEQNTPTGQAIYGETHFKITTDAAGENAVQGLEDFTLQGGKLPQDVASLLRSLPRGEYFLFGFVGEGDFYLGLSPQSCDFSVLAATSGVFSAGDIALLTCYILLTCILLGLFVALIVIKCRATAKRR